ncbi:MAG: NAD(+)/NADH kinase [Acidimicrobiales bacterium]
MSTIAFVIHPERPEAADLASRATEWLADRGHDVVLTEGDEECIDTTADPQLDGADLAVSLGGDGTMLRTVNLAWAPGVPVLGVNLGHLGYLTEVEPSGLEVALEKFLSGDYSLEERMMLDVSWRSPTQGPVGRCLALNEAVLEKTVPGHTIRLAASIGGRPFVTYAADGLIVATATGSTAYNLSVRGPILSPGLKAVIVTPISPHMLFDRPLVLDPSESLELTVAGPRPGVLVVDGRTVATLDAGDVMSCAASERAVRLVTFGPRDFHAILRARFHLSDR